ncbi:hypothetical protein PL321_15140 [Caloramator sp. mosi_1]|uniref:hypothetical protein n=1 Tax=Caloramator sp. mosi_1 TaxID=3023090 RepID=UPI002360C27D|nr:hypothetical protein [Caloramator sp. mosi_1]WDC83812.1 hypothetical protein PL321_15140 [Caloramator sp. mosi_1]
MRKIKCLIVEDEMPAIEELRFHLSKYSDFVIEDYATSYNDAVAKIEDTTFDVVFGY